MTIVKFLIDKIQTLTGEIRYASSFDKIRSKTHNVDRWQCIFRFNLFKYFYLLEKRKLIN